jgi:hypothetical protein
MGEEVRRTPRSSWHLLATPIDFVLHCVPPAAAPPPPPLSPSGIVDCGKQVVNEEGVRALWKGLTPFATHLTLKYALRMGSNSVYQVRGGAGGGGGREGG